MLCITYIIKLSTNKQKVHKNNNSELITHCFVKKKNYLIDLVFKNR